jgi:hypothetical protein
MKKRTVITTEKREVWVVREGSADLGLANLSDTVTIGLADEIEEPEAEQLERNQEP